jgi:RND superfamily putative drug exporter
MCACPGSAKRDRDASTVTRAELTADEVEYLFAAGDSRDQEPIMASFARWCYRHRIIVLVAWLVVLATVIGVEHRVGSAYTNTFNLPGTESTKALNLLSAALPKQSGDSDSIVWHVANGSVNGPAVRTRITALLQLVAKAPSVASVTSPYSPRGAAQISRDGKTAYATVVFTKLANALPRPDVERIISLVKAAGRPGLKVAIGGQAIEQVAYTPPSNSVAIGLIAAAIIILIAFGSLLGMALPLITAVVALGTATFAIGLFSHVMGVTTFAPTLADLIGLGVGIDYSLFIVTRYRDGLKAGLPPEEAAVRALNTAGRAVIFAGGTVCIALLGLLVLRLHFMNGLSISSAMTVLLAMATAITLLPALFGFMGMRVLSRRERQHLADHGAHEVHRVGFWARWAGFVSHRSVVLMLCAVALMLVLASPYFALRLGLSDAGNDRAGTTTREAYDMLAAAFGPGFNGPLTLVAQTGSSADQAALQRLEGALAKQPGIAAVVPFPSRPGARVAIVEVFPTTSPQDARTSALITHLRDTVVPPFEHGTTLRVYVGGPTAIFGDFAAVIGGKMPLFIAVIVGLGFLLLLVAFRSLLVPATAAVMNLLAAGAAFGVLVVVFQFGWGARLLGLGKAGPIEAFLPVMMLAILFGLSMDYQVFLVSRMHEEWVHTGDNEHAVTVGQATTGRVISAAAAIMICVFLAFAFGGQRIIAEAGIGLAAAVFLDAAVIRTVLVPSLMHLFGWRNWWLPKALDRRLPHLSVEPVEDAQLPYVAAEPDTAPQVPPV